MFLNGLLSFMIVILFKRKWWYNFFSDAYKDVKQSKRFTATSGNVYIHGSRFVSLENKDGNGGSISFESGSTDSKLVVERTSIVGSSASKKGGGIYFNSEGQCILSKLCGFKCNSLEMNCLILRLLTQRVMEVQIVHMNYIREMACLKFAILILRGII